MIGPIYDYAVLCRQYFKDGHQRGRLMTDIDLSTEEGMTLHRRLAYYLYPIMIRSYQDAENPDYLIYLHKKDAVNAVPHGYVINFKINDNNLMATRKDLL